MKMSHLDKYYLLDKNIIKDKYLIKYFNREGLCYESFESYDSSDKEILRNFLIKKNSDKYNLINKINILIDELNNFNKLY